MRGTIKWYHITKHFGFLLADEGNREVFFHVNDCRGFVPEEGIYIEFEPGLDRKGRPKAVKINRVCVGGKCDSRKSDSRTVNTL